MTICRLQASARWLSTVQALAWLWYMYYEHSSILSLKVGHFLMHFPSRFSGLGKLARSLLVGCSVLSPWLYVTTVPTSVEPRAYTATIRVLTIVKLIFPWIFGKGASINDVSSEGEGGQKLPILLSKKTTNGEGGGVIKSEKWAKVFYGWPLITLTEKCISPITFLTLSF